MKISRTTYAAIALIELFPTSVFSEKNTSFRVFRTTRSKAGKAMTPDASIPPSHVPYSDPEAITQGSKASKDPVGAKVLKDFLPAKAGKIKCHEEDIDLSEFERRLDLSSFCMSSSMAYSMSMGSKSSKATTKCYKYPESTKSAKTSSEASDKDFSLEQDDYFSFDDDNIDAALHVRFVLEHLSICDGTTLDFDACLIENLITAIAYPSDDDLPRMLRAGEMKSVESVGDDWQVTNECILPSEDEIKFVLDQATRICVDSGVQISSHEYNGALDSFLSIFTNKVCMCAW